MGKIAIFQNEKLYLLITLGSSTLKSLRCSDISILARSPADRLKCLLVSRINENILQHISSLETTWREDFP